MKNKSFDPHTKKKLNKDKNKTFSYFKGRIGKREFLWNSIFFVVILILAKTYLMDDAYITYPIMVPMIASLTIQRLHDLGRPAYHFLLLLIPVYHFIFLINLCVQDGQKGENVFGPDPL